MSMMRLTRFVWLAAATILLAGCYMRVVMSGSKVSPDEALGFGVVVRTEPGEAYSDRGNKTVYLSIYRHYSEPREYLFKGQYKFVVADLDWQVDWETPDRVQVRLFEYPPGVNMFSQEAVEGKVPTVPVAAFTFVRKPGGEVFDQVGVTEPGRTGSEQPK